MLSAWRWVFGVVLGVAILGLPALRYRVIYSNEKRFREMTPGKFYRCGQMSESGFRKHLKDHGIKLVINLQDEFPDPELPAGYWDKPHIAESRVCAEEGVKYQFLSFFGDRGLLPRRDATPEHRPLVIDDFLKLCDDPSNYPILIHCMAGLHRTGALAAIYRMEYEDWSLAEAVRELRANGYGDRKCTTANDYIYEYLYLYKPRRPKAPEPAPRGSPP